MVFVWWWCGGVSVWWCLCGGGVVVFSCLCDGVCFFFLRCCWCKKISGIKVLPTHAHIHNHIKHFLYSTVFNASHYGEDMQRALATLVYKNIWCKSSPYTAHIHNHIKHVLYSTVFIQLSLMLSGYPASSFFPESGREGFFQKKRCH